MSTGKAIGAIATGIVAALLIVSMWVFSWGFFSRATADFRGETEQIEKTRADGDYRIGAYERFFDLCAAVQSKEAAIASLQQELETNPPAGRVTQVNATITAVRNSRAELINEYNADAAKTDTRAAFHASDLPHELDHDLEKTTCAAPSE